VLLLTLLQSHVGIKIRCRSYKLQYRVKKPLIYRIIKMKCAYASVHLQATKCDMNVKMCRSLLRQHCLYDECIISNSLFEFTVVDKRDVRLWEIFTFGHIQMLIKMCFFVAYCAWGLLFYL